MDDPLVFDSIRVAEVRQLGSTTNGVRHFEIEVDHVADGREVAMETITARMTDYVHSSAMLPVEEYVARSVVAAAGCRNDGRKLDVLLQRVNSDGGSLLIREPADLRDFGQPVPPQFVLPAGLR